MTVVALITAALSALPIIWNIIKLFQSTPVEKRKKLRDKIHNAINHARENKGDTSKIEDVLRNL